MSGHRLYKITDFRFGQMVAGLREKAGLTQQEAANALHVSRRTIQHWEAGTAFPGAAHVKALIAYYLPYGTFPHSHELEEARRLWEQADESSTRHKTPFDESWFKNLLRQPLPGPFEKYTIVQVIPSQEQAQHPTRIDWGDAPDLVDVYGRERELSDLARWVLNDRCHLVAILGIGGIGKTTLAVKFAQVAAPQFDSVIWRSLRNAPPLPDLLAECLQTLSSGAGAKPSIALLLEIFQQQRCLLILDNAETLFRRGRLSGDYRPGYEEYQALFKQVAQTRHQSCLLLTSREIPTELEPIEGAQETVRAMKIAGLTRGASQSLLNEKELFGAADAWDAFVYYYAGNPLALKIAAAIVRDLFGGDLGAFLKEAPVTLHTLHLLLENQFEHLSDLERDVLFWLAIERDPVSLEVLRADLLGTISKNDLLPALLSLRRRSLIERGDSGAVFHLQPVLLEFITDHIVKQVSEEIVRLQQGTITRVALMKSRSADYIRESQVRLIVQPVLSNLVEALGDKAHLTAHLRTLIQRIRSTPAESQGYAGGNLVNLLASLLGSVCSEDFSRLALRQVYLQGIDAQDTNFSDAEFIEARFTEPLETSSTMMVSPSGQYLAAGTYNGQIRVWKVTDGKPLWTSSGARHEWCLTFSPDENLLVSGGYHGQVCIWDTATGRRLNTFEGHGFWVYTVAFHPDGHTLVSAGSDETIRVWDLDDGLFRLILHGHEGRIYSSVFSPDGKLLVTSGNDGTARIWDLSSGRCLRILQHAAGKTTLRVALHPEGRVLATCSEEDPLVKLWDVLTGDLLKSFYGHTQWSGRVAFNPEGTFLACGCGDGTVELWEMKDQSNPQFFRMLIGHHHHLSVLAFAQHGLLATQSLGENVRLWDVHSGKLLRTIQGYSRLIASNAFSPDGKLLVQGDANGMVRLYDVAGNRYLTTFQAHSGLISCVRFSPDGRSFASCADDRVVRLWDTGSYQCLKTFTLNTSDLWAIAFSPDGSLLATSGVIRKIDLWDTRPDGPTAVLKELLSPDDEIWSLAFDPTGKILACGYENGMVHLFNVETGRLLASFEHGSIKVVALRFSSNGKILVSSSYHDLLKWWDLATGVCLQTLHEEAAGNRNSDVAIGRDGLIVVTGSAEPDIVLWRTDSPGKPHQVTRLPGHASKVWAVALSPDERLVASSDVEGTTLISDAQAGTVLRKIPFDRPYERMKINGLTGLNAAERAALKAMGAIDNH